MVSLQKLKKDFAENEDAVKLLDLALPESDMLAEVIETIKDIASDSVVEISSIKQTKSKDNSSTTISIAFEGSYSSFKMFLEDIENNIRLITPTKITLNETKNTEDGESFLKGTLELNFFKVKTKASAQDKTNSNETGSEE